MTAFQSAIDRICMRLFGRTVADAHAETICIKCGAVQALGKMSRAETNEYLISGFCPTCFDSLFPDDDCE